jgi:Protein of unknown function (DUF3047)
MRAWLVSGNAIEPGRETPNDIMHATTAFLAALIAAGPALAEQVAFGPSLAREGWQDQTFPGYPPSQFSARGARVLQISSNMGNSLIWRLLPLDLAGAVTATWRWRVAHGVPPTDLAVRRSADRSIALYFLFADDSSVLERPPHSLRAALSNGRTLVYVWGGIEATGSIIPSPTLGERGKILVQRPANSPTGAWQSEWVDLRADFHRAFGRDPGPLLGIAVSSDSESTGTITDAALADLVVR